ncbi:MAG: inositol monophosphatase family protein [Myxococcota bacterium]
MRVAEALAREAGQRMLRARRGGIEIEYKGTNDLVTNVDREVERFLRGELRAMFPSDGIMGEEYGEREGEAGPNRQWLIDPIDGTTNFSRGIPTFCVSIALQVHGHTAAAAIYDPNLDELFSARRGGGATLNGRPMHVSETERMRDAMQVTGFPPLKSGDTFETIIQRLGQMIGASRGVRRFGSAAMDLAYVAEGRLDGFWEFDLNPWDTAAGYLLVEEAGGRVSDVHGNMFSAHEASVVATNGVLHDKALELLRQVTGGPTLPTPRDVPEEEAPI